MNASILIVEDEGLIALDLKKRLEQAGYTVQAIVDNAEEALESAERLEPSLILMDIRLHGGVDGVETADRIRKRLHIPVIFVTAHADRETLNRARITEPFGYIVKPFHAIDFRVQIEIALWKHKMEQKLRVSEARLSSTFQNVADALIATDGDGNVSLMNATAAALTGWIAAEAKGRAFSEVFCASDEVTGVPIDSPDSFANGYADSRLRTFILTPCDGSDRIIVEAEISANRDDGRLFGIIVAFRDITERRRAERRDRQLHKMNALTLMATGLGRELAESQTRMDESIKYMIEQARGETSRLLWDVYEQSARQQSIVQQLMTLGRTDAGRAVEVDLNEVLGELQEPMTRALGINRSLTLNLHPGVPSILTDPKFLRENLLRLVTDSRHATAKGASVEISTATVRTSDGKPAARIVIRDDRKVAARTKDRIFDPYYQSGSGKRNPGFSLALVCQFVALSGGTIDVETRPNEGSAYYLTFPAATGSFSELALAASA